MKQFCIYAAYNRATPFEKRISLIKESGFHFVCLNFEKELAPTESSWENQLKTAQKYSLPVNAAHLTGSGANALWGESGEKSVYAIIDMKIYR